MHNKQRLAYSTNVNVQLKKILYSYPRLFISPGGTACVTGGAGRDFLCVGIHPITPPPEVLGLAGSNLRTSSF